MGLAASQARFLCITARKADCQYRSTELAQQKLEITNQLADIANNYANAMNATKLVWDNDVINNDYGVSYNLLMSPSAANDYNPYMVTTASGAIILNSDYARAAKAAGISKSGGIGSQTSRDKFIQALVPSGYVTKDTANAITHNDFIASVDNSTNQIVFTNPTVASVGGVNWNPAAGMGSAVLNKSIVDIMTLTDLANSDAIGNQPIDWGQMVVTAGHVTKIEFERNKEKFNDLILDSMNHRATTDMIAQLETDKKNVENDTTLSEAQKTTKTNEIQDLINKLNTVLQGNSGAGALTQSEVDSLFGRLYTKFNDDKNQYIAAHGTSNANVGNSYFNTTGNNLDLNTCSIVVNGQINHYKSELENLTIGDLLTGNVVLVSKGDKTDFVNKVKKLMESIIEILGYSPDRNLIGTGLNVDERSAEALEFAYKMMMHNFLRNTAYKCSTGSRYSNCSMTENSAYLNAVKYNGFTTDDNGAYKAASLSNMVSMFLTYYDNALNGASSNYVVGKTTDTSVYVTDNAGYYYVVQNDNRAITSTAERTADFFDQLYNNLCEHGWREDDAIQDYEYLESSLKNGRYSMMSLSKDGYFYQTRYSDTGYIREESDTDAISRAEAEFTAMKAELTYKEDTIDLKTKQLDAEIAALNTEYETVKNLISNSISKTFAMFQGQ